MMTRDVTNSGLEEEATDIKYSVGDILRQGFSVDNPMYNSIREGLVERLCENCGYIEEILCMFIVMKMLEPQGFRICIRKRQSDDSRHDAYFSNVENRVVLLVSENEDDMYMALMDQLIYRVLVSVGFSNNDKHDIMSILDQIKDTTRSCYEELTQEEIKMLEWLDIKVIDLVDNLYGDDNYCRTDAKNIDEGVVNLLWVYLTWGRKVERLEIVASILNPLTEYLQNTVLAKIENFVINNKELSRIQIPDYFKVKLDTMKILSEEDISYSKRIRIIRDVRVLDILEQTFDMLDELSYMDKEKIEITRSLYKLSIIQRKNELRSIEKREQVLKKNRYANKETLTKLSNLKDIIQDEEVNLEKSLMLMDEKINLSEGVGV